MLIQQQGHQELLPGRSLQEPSVLALSLEELVGQFALAGTCVVWFNRQQGQLYPVTFGVQASDKDPSLPAVLCQLFAPIDWHQIAQQPYFEPQLIDRGKMMSPLGRFYCCTYVCTDEWIGGLLVWNHSFLSPHQRYGVTLYTKTLINQDLLRLPLPGSNSCATDQVLQRLRHQLSTPLALMLLYIDLLKTTIVNQQPQEWLDNLRSTVETMQVSLKRETDTKESMAFCQQDCDLRQLLQDCVQDLQPWIQEKQLQVVCDLPSIRLSVDQWKMKQVFQNVLSNAIAFSPIGGDLLCEGQAFSQDMVITIRDQGPGLSAEDLEAMWLPFYSRRPGGTGLGLSIAQQFVREHQGDLWAENLADGGAKFYVRLPLFVTTQPAVQSWIAPSCGKPPSHLQPPVPSPWGEGES